MKRFFAFFLVLSMMILFASCAVKPEPETPPAPVAEQSTEPEPEPISEPEPIPEHNSKLVGVSMPTKDLQRWNQDGTNMEAMLKEAGCKVDLQFADRDPTQQIKQIQNMIDNGAKVLVIAAIDPGSLCPVLAEAKEAGVAVIAYDRLIWDSDAVTYFITFDITLISVMQGQYIEKTLDLANAGDKTYNIEFITGDPGDGNINFYYDGAMNVLQKYLDAGTLVCVSGQTAKMEVATEGWDAVKAQERFENILSTYYADKQLDAVMASNDSTAQGVAAALETSYTNKVYPIITGMDCDVLSVRNILEGKQAMSVFKDTRDLAAKAVEMSIAILNGEEPEINDTETYDNGTGIIPTYLCPPRICTIDNYKELLLDSGYYYEDDFEEIKSYVTGPFGTAKVSQYVKYQVKNEHIIIIGLSDEGKRQKDIQIPSMIDGKPVTEIKAKAFQNCLNLTSVSIPEGVISIGSEAFSSCKRLNSITIPESVESLGKEAFSNCKNLTAIYIPKGVTSIEGFNNCTSLTDITIPEGVASIEGFNNCTSLTDITIPEGVTSIKGFNNCTSLTDIAIPEGVTSIGGFNDCTSLTDIAIPEGVTSIGGFNDCTGLQCITFPQGTTDINGFDRCTNLTDIIIPEGVTNIDGFSGCTSLTDIQLPSNPYFPSIDSIFDDCTSLKSIEFPEGVTDIFGFNYCLNLTELTIPKSATRISGFIECANIKDVYYAGTEEQWNQIDFSMNKHEGVKNGHYYCYIPDNCILNSNVTVHFNCS